MQEFILNDDDLFVMNLIHYFITEKNYSPVIIHGIKDEVWLENMDNDYKIVRIVSHHIHNDEQLSYDRFKLNQIVKKLKLKTLSFHMNVLNIYVDIGDDVKLSSNDLYIKNEKGIKNDALVKIFPDIVEKTSHEEDGLRLFMKITDDINDTNVKKNKIVDKIFSKKTPIVTYMLILVNVITFILTYIYGYDYVIYKYGMFGGGIKSGEYYRLITSMFLHGGIIHLFANMYSLYVIGSQIESFFGKTKYLIIYMISGICGGLLSSIFNINSISVGASGALFGLLGSIMYFGYYYRTYLGNVIRSQILPIIVINLAIGFMTPGIDNFAHIGGLIGGVMSTMMVGVPDKESKQDKINGLIVLTVFVIFIMYLISKI